MMPRAPSDRLPRYAEIVCFAIAAVLTVVLLAQACSRILASPSPAAHPAVANRVAAAGDEPSSADQPHGMTALQQVEQRNVFAPIPQAAQLTGVLGRHAIFDGNRFVAVGETIDDATVIAIDADSVSIERDGEEQVLQVFSGRSPVQPTPGPPTTARAPRSSEPPAVRPATPAPSEQDIQRFRRMPQERQQQLLEQMPPELAERIRDAL